MPSRIGFFDYFVMILLSTILLSCGAGSSTSRANHCQDLEKLEGEDPLFRKQWYIHEGLNGDICSVWREYTGRGIVVGIFDAAIELTHAELSQNVLPGKSYDFKTASFVGEGDNPSFLGSHGNNVAGLIAARGNNGRGIRGIAWEANFFSYNIIYNNDPTDSSSVVEARYENAAKAHLDLMTISSNSWNEGSGHSFSPSWRSAIEEGLRSTPSSGTGEGISYLFSVGNGGATSWSTLDRFSNFYGVINVCAINRQGVLSSYSTPGSSLWICATGGSATGDILTLDFEGSAGASSDDYEPHFNGTSASTPIAAGIVALVRQANPSLSWRDIKVLLADTARMPKGVSTVTGGNMYSQMGKKYAYSYSYGYGIIDTKKAVDAAKAWEVLPTFLNETSSQSSLSSSFSSPLSDTLAISGNPIQFIEHVALKISLSSSSLPVKIYLTSPQGQRVKVLSNEVLLRLEGSSPNEEAYLGLTPFLGQEVNGDWTVEISSSSPVQDTTYTGKWYLEFVGH